MQGAQNLRREAYLQVRRNDEGEVQRSRWTFYETINFDWPCLPYPVCIQVESEGGQVQYHPYIPTLQALCS